MRRVVFQTFIIGNGETLECYGQCTPDEKGKSLSFKEFCFSFFLRQTLIKLSKVIKTVIQSAESPRA